MCLHARAARMPVHPCPRVFATVCRDLRYGGQRSGLDVRVRGRCRAGCVAAQGRVRSTVGTACGRAGGGERREGGTLHDFLAGEIRSWKGSERAKIRA